MVSLILFLLPLLTFGTIQAQVIKLSVADIITFEFAFGDDNLKDEYLLASPDFIAVDGNNNIYVADERRIKVYSAQGKELAILGKPGQGPGEFETAENISISSSGFISVANRNKFNIYDNKYIFLDTHNRKIPDFFSGSFPKLIEISDNEMIWDEAFLNYEDNGIFKNRKIFSKIGDSVTEIVSYTNKSTYMSAEDADGNTMSGVVDTGAEGSLLWKMLPNGNIIYTHTSVNKSVENNKYYYELLFYDVVQNEKRSIKREYTPASLPESLIKRYEDRKNRNELSKIRWEYIKDLKYYSPLSNIFVDKDRIFCFTKLRNDNNEIAFDIFDAGTGEFIKQELFPAFDEYRFAPHFIKNGKVYYINRGGRNDFPKIEVYSFNPSVYEK